MVLKIDMKRWAQNLVSRSSHSVAHDGVIEPAHQMPLRTGPEPLAEPVAAKFAPLEIPCPDPTAEDSARDLHQTMGQRLARQENWTEISQAIRAAESACEKTPGGMTVAELISFGARSDVVQAAEHALLNGKPAKDAPLLDGIVSLEEVLAEHPDDYAIALVVAQAHIDIGWAWRGTGWTAEIPDRNRAAFEAHFDRAQSILKDFCAVSHASPLLAATCCAVRAGLSTDVNTVVVAYERLIDLDPLNARSFRAMGNHLLPRWFGTVHDLELQARRMAGRTHHIWGAGAYTWVLLDAIAYDDQVCASIDLEFFIEGMRDILERKPDQHTVNLLAAYCANTLGMTSHGSDEAALVRAQIADCARWIIRQQLTELHPMLWAHAARGFDNNLRVRCPHRFAASGHADAVRFLTDMFRREIAEGQRIIFTPHGAQTEPA